MLVMAAGAGDAIVVGSAGILNQADGEAIVLDELRGRRAVHQKVAVAVEAAIPVVLAAATYGGVRTYRVIVVVVASPHVVLGAAEPGRSGSADFVRDVSPRSGPVIMPLTARLPSWQLRQNMMPVEGSCATRQGVRRQW